MVNCFNSAYIPKLKSIFFFNNAKLDLYHNPRRFFLPGDGYFVFRYVTASKMTAGNAEIQAADRKCF